MKFHIGTPDYTRIFEKVTRIKVYLRTGPAEIYENHQDLLGKVRNNIVELDTVTDGKTQTYSYVFQESVFIVSSKGKPETTCYSYGTRCEEISSETPIEEIKQEIQEKKERLEIESKKLMEKGLIDPISSIYQTTILSLKDDIEFLQKILDLVNARK